MSYDRSKAIDYARTYWTIPCKDGLLGTEHARPSIDQLRHNLHAPASEWRALFARDGTGTERGVFRKQGEDDKIFQGWDGLDDCAHYVSQCFRAGGLGIDTQWGARELKESMQRVPNTKTLIEKATVKAGQRIVDAGLIKEADAIIYYNADPSEGTPVGYHHSAMYVGDGGITCHSVCRYKSLGDSSDDEWHLNAGQIYKYTFIHFSDDDSASSIVKKALAGWWKVQYARQTAYYVVLSNGSARKSQTPPRKSTDQPPNAPSAYWSQKLNSVKFAWKDGDLE